MATLEARLSALAGAIRDKINLMMPRLVPSGGLINQVLAKSSASDYAMAWVNAGAGSDAWAWLKLASDVANSTVTLAPATGLTFTAAANTTYIVEVIGAFTAAATTTGIALALDIPSGNIAGRAFHPTSATALGSNEQIADNATTGATTGVRAANTNVPITARFIVAIGATGGAVQLQFRSEIAASAVTLKAAITAMGYRAI